MLWLRKWGRIRREVDNLINVSMKDLQENIDFALRGKPCRAFLIRQRFHMKKKKINSPEW